MFRYIINKLKNTYSQKTDYSLIENSNIPLSEIINESRVLAPAISEIINEINNSIIPGMTTIELERISKEIIEEKGFIPAMLGYNGYPAATGISINEEILHAIPSSRKILEGDLVTIQTSIRGKAAFASQGWTFKVGSVSEKNSKFHKIGQIALKEGIGSIVSGSCIGDIGATIQSVIEGAGYSVIRDFVGTGMGKRMIQEPNIPCFGKRGIWAKIKPGMILNIHVIASMGESNLYIADDNWTAVTSDNQPSVLFTAMVLIEQSDVSILSDLIGTHKGS
ncbi:MAG: type I methionyl aminopeptidase [Deltaproteobacteria bacterium]|nr:type I methionyl aminopeptidase [Deltaproteobacteria bacterium]